MPSKTSARRAQPHLKGNSACTESCPHLSESAIAAAWNADTQHGTHGSRGYLTEEHPKAAIRDAAATTSRCVGSEKVASRSGARPAIYVNLRFLQMTGG
jgi:hypothetical protein